MTPPLRERQPHGSGWDRQHGREADTPQLAERFRSTWRYGKVLAISALGDAELPDRSGTGPQWHVSISRSGRRPSPSDVRKALRSFGMVGAEEDNHHSGNARHFWLPVDPAHRVDCECKTDEQVIVETDGYTWTNPRPETGEACRGCEGEAITGRPCPIHRAAGVTVTAHVETPRNFDDHEPKA